MNQTNYLLSQTPENMGYLIKTKQKKRENLSIALEINKNCYFSETFVTETKTKINNT